MLKRILGFLGFSDSAISIDGFFLAIVPVSIPIKKKLSDTEVFKFFSLSLSISILAAALNLAPLHRLSSLSLESVSLFCLGSRVENFR